MGTQPDARLITEAQTELARFLSDEIAPMIFAGSAEVLFRSSPEIMARGIHSWVGIQLQGANASSIGDYLLHSARKVHNLGELELIPRKDLREFLERLMPMLLSICPEGERAELAANLNHLKADLPGGEAVAARISVSKSPAARSGDTAAQTGGFAPVRDGEEPGATGGQRSSDQHLQEPPAAARQEAPPSGGDASAPAAGDLTSAHIDRLNLLLDRWERLSSKRTAPAASANLNTSLADAQNALISRIIDEVASSARSNADLNSQLRYLSDIGIGPPGSGVFRILSGALPDWAPAQAPGLDGSNVPPLSGAAQVMKKVVDLATDPEELKERFRDLISTAIEQFNSGSLGRAVTVLDLAQRMVTQKEIDSTIASKQVAQAAEKLDEGRLRSYAENEDKRLLLRRVLRFFPKLHVDELIQDLFVEERRDRRRLLLRLLMIHGDEARSRAIKLLDESLSGNVPRPWYVQRNLIYLMRSIQPSEENDIDKEIDLLVRASVPGAELPLIREALTALGQIDHPRSVKTLVARVSDFEDAALQKDYAAHQASDIQSLLDTATKAMLRFESKEARQCIVSHGLKRRPEFGNTLARLALLGGLSLADDPSTVSLIVEAIKNELPVKVFGVSVKSSKRAQNLEYLFESLSGTDTPLVRKVYDSIVRKYPGERFANAAAKCLTQLGSRAESQQAEDEATTITSLSGDLALFGLPNLMQNLADSRVEGVLTVLDDVGSSSASITIRDGMMIDADAGDLHGETAVYQLLERPISGRFIFVNQPITAPSAEGQHTGIAMMSLLMEGMRRYDEFNRAATMIPDDGRFVATGKQPTSLPDEDDAEFVNGIWLQATRGTTPRAIERGAKVDGYRVFRLFEHWLNEGSLEIKAETA